jgi:dTDP-4-amino-4,6-dideoxygalactose transaminase
MKNIQMVDLISQYENIKTEVDKAVIEVMSTARFIKGPKVSAFEKHLSEYLGVKHSITCANGTDALQIALMALDLKSGDEVIVPAFTYVATAEVIGLLGLTPVMVDVDKNSFNVTAETLEKAITPKTKVIVPVHLYGQSSDMEDIMVLAKKHNLYVVEDNAQAIGADYIFEDGTVKKTGTIGHIGCTSFFPSKNLGCYGDGGAIFTNDDELAVKLRMIANHGQVKKYHHSVIGVNSRLDAMQAVVLDIKLAKLDEYSVARQQVAAAYDEAFKNVEAIKTPFRQHNSTHVFHQYTLQITNGKRDELKQFLADNNIPSMVYYPIPLYKQDAFKEYYRGDDLPVTEVLCSSVLSLPIHTEMDDEISYIISKVQEFFSKN